MICESISNFIVDYIAQSAEIINVDEQYIDI
jgi:uncharacterized membrane protein YwzB